MLTLITVIMDLVYYLNPLLHLLHLDLPSSELILDKSDTSNQSLLSFPHTHTFSLVEKISLDTNLLKPITLEPLINLPDHIHLCNNQILQIKDFQSVAHFNFLSVIPSHLSSPSPELSILNSIFTGVMKTYPNIPTPHPFYDVCSVPHMTQIYSATIFNDHAQTPIMYTSVIVVPEDFFSNPWNYPKTWMWDNTPFLNAPKTTALLLKKDCEQINQNLSSIKTIQVKSNSFFLPIMDLSNHLDVPSSISSNSSRLDFLSSLPLSFYSLNSTSSTSSINLFNPTATSTPEKLSNKHTPN